MKKLYRTKGPRGFELAERIGGDFDGANHWSIASEQEGFSPAVQTRRIGGAFG